ncbi:MAG: hypothetical protein ACLRFI_01565 [Alphaproteobacteria bacterium]
MQTIQILLIVLAFLLFVVLGVLFFISRKTQKVMQSVLTVMTQPDKTKVQDAQRVLSAVLVDEISKISALFQNLHETLQKQIESANELKNTLTTQNDNLVQIADNATQRITNMSQRLENTVGTLNNIVDSESWKYIETSTDKFSETVSDMLSKIDETTGKTTEQITSIDTQINSWIENSDKLNESTKNGFDTNAQQIQSITSDITAMQTKLNELNKDVATGFDTIKSSADNYESVLKNEDSLMNEHINKLDNYTKQAKKQLTSQMNMLTNTANVVGGQVMLAESSVERQIRKLTDTVESLMNSATTTEKSVSGVASELANLTNRFNSEIKEFATDVVSEIKNVSGVANTTLENTRSVAGEFSESVKSMTNSVRETLIEMNTAHMQLSGQSENLIKTSAETTAQLQPLSELIEKYYSALPDLSQGSLAANEALTQTVSNLNEKIDLMKNTVAESTTAISKSAEQLDDLAGQSRQQMIDLMSDYAKAVDTMKTLNNQMMVARASAPMDAIKTAPSGIIPGASASDFLAQSDTILAKIHEQSMDLTKAIGVDIPDIVWKKYHDGDKTIFSKWLAKMLGAANKKQIRDKLKSDAVFRSQATQFVRSFDKVIDASERTDMPDAVKNTLLKSDLGKIYTILKG